MGACSFAAGGVRSGGGWYTVLAPIHEEDNKQSKAKRNDGEGLYMRGRTDRRDSRQSRGKSRSKSRGYVKKDEQPSSSGSTYDNSEVMMVMSAQAQALLDWIMDSGCSDHMTPRYIPELKRNLISLGTLEKEGFTVKLQSGKVKVINGSRVVLSGIQKDNCVYSLDGHAMAGLHVLEKQGLFGKKNLGKLAFYENCVLGKSHRVSFGVGRHTTRGVIDYVHLELWGPSHVDSLGGKRYFLSVIDDYSRRIARHLTVDETPQENGLAERMNKTLMDKVRCLLTQSGLPKTFWAEATCTAAYLIKRSPSTAIEKKTPCGDVVRTSKISQGFEGYRLYKLDDESPKIVTSRFVVFNESVMYKDTLKDSGACADKSVEELQEEQKMRVSRSSSWAKADDMLIACKSKAEIGSTKSLLKKEFDMKKLEEAKKILGIEIVKDWSRKILRVSQSGYVSKILNNFRIDNGKSLKIPLGGHFKLSLKDCSVKDCDVERMISVVSKYLANPGKNHWEALKWILKYLRGTENVGLVYGTNRGNHVDVTGFVDSDNPKDPDKGLSTSMCFIKEVLETKTVKVLKVGTGHNAAYALTNVVPGLKLQHCLELLNIIVG
uniref:Retrovirus-related Pol polyprotein from transposon TNT 1-94 n=1 Tax=Tanacetum cinerariifolium TaxID=118510 RepID=A0A699II24_TANCI|nr:retrovirus-related Pol polyprotein from transposon TNT 1-94 [Tanacetum cinerariifolium]